MHLHFLFLFLSCLLLAQPKLGLMSTNPNITAVTNTSFFIAKPNCQPSCGNITVPYPFGIGQGSGCSISSWFELTCNTTAYDPPKLFLGSLEVLSISQTQLKVRNVISAKCYDQSGGVAYDEESGMNWGDDWPYTFSDMNKFTVVGCDAYAFLSSLRQGHQFSTGCMSKCSNRTDVNVGDCSGIGCCQIDIPKGLKNYTGSSPGTVGNYSEVLSFDSCTYAFLGEQDSFKFNGLSDFNDDYTSFINRTLDSVPVVLDFVIGNQSCAAAQNLNSSSCQNNTSCTDSDIGNGGYLCSCMDGYEGNPYLSPGCTDIDECNNTILNNCAGNATCTNTPGSFYCTCLDHYTGNGTTTGTGCSPIPSQPEQSQLWLKLFLGLSISFLSLVISVTWLYFGIKRRKLIKLREKFFQQNGGLLMKEKLSSIDGIGAESSKLFTAEELKKATNNYADDQILGQGGYGVVYKGTLLNKRVVAIKKSKVMDVNQVEQFINELLILTQINHRNVVKVLGCCFESEVPELVYEYISNGTLSQHIHTTICRLTLDDRLRIATEAASALSHLHSTTSIPIIHRDVKSANILLDANYVAKIADFGASRLVPVDQTQVNTLVQGTFGYLDPEYLQSSQLTEKSDVYSFGVVLAELFTRKKVICSERSETERNLATYFILSMKENRLFQILDPQMVREGMLEQLQAIGELVKRCLCLKSEERPTMKEVVTELERLRKYQKDPWVNLQNDEDCASLISDEARVDSYNEPIALSTNASYPSSHYTFNCSTSFPLNSSRYN